MDVYDSQKTLAGISFTLSKLKVVSTAHGKKILLNPTTCSVILPHLFPTLTQCHIMVILFSYIFFPRYALRVVGSRATLGLRFPDISTLTTSLLQEKSLQTLRKHGVVAFKTLSDENCRIRRIIFIVTNDRGSSHNNLLGNSYHSGFAAEQTIVTDSIPDAMVTEQYLVTKGGGENYPKNH